MRSEEKIHQAAIRAPNGRITTSDYHYPAWRELLSTCSSGEEVMEQAFALLDHEEGWEEGFTTTTGRFVSREEAYQIATAARQMRNPEEHEGALCAEELLP